MSWEQFLSWQIYYSLEPWGEKLHDAQIAQVVSVLAEINRDKKQRPEAFAINDFTLIKDETMQQATPRRTKPLTDLKQWNLICGVLNTGRKVSPKPKG